MATQTPIQELEATKAQLASVTTKLTEAESSLAQFEAKLVSANSSATKANIELAESMRKVAELQTSLAKAESKVAVVQGELDSLKADFDQKVIATASGKASQIVAGQGIPPIQSNVNSQPASAKVDEPTKFATPEAAFAAGFVKDMEAINRR